ncbi:MAG: response regulator [Ignavibacteriales bacterium]|nr:response regulator [Ignavibacteriales bacterium]
MNDEINKTAGDEKNNIRSILLIEDDAINASVIQRFLRNDFKVDIGFNGLKGLELAEANSYCLVLLDINLGRGINGIEVLHHLKKNEKFLNVPMIASTAYTMKGDKERLFEAGFDDYISKPYTMDEILIKIKEHLKQI